VNLVLNNAAELEVPMGLIMVDPALIEVRDCGILSDILLSFPSLSLRVRGRVDRSPFCYYA